MESSTTSQKGFPVCTIVATACEVPGVVGFTAHAYVRASSGCLPALILTPLIPLQHLCVLCICLVQCFALPLPHSSSSALFTSQMPFDLLSPLLCLAGPVALLTLHSLAFAQGLSTRSGLACMVLVASGMWEGAGRGLAQSLHLSVSSLIYDL